MRLWILLSLPLMAAPLFAEPASDASASMNQITGTVLSIDTDDHVLRLNVEGGFKVEFTYDSATAITDHQKPITAGDLEFGDRITVRYVGKELQAKQIERTETAARTIPSAPPEIAPAPVPEVSTVTQPSGPDGTFTAPSSSGPAAPAANPR